MKVKICGMKYPDNILEVAKLSPDFMGFNFYPMSKRFTGDDFILPGIPASIKKTGVFVNEGEKNILQKVEKYKLDYVQLHGDEPADFCNKLSRSLKLLESSSGIIKAFGIDEQFDFSIVDEFENSCEYFLFDTKTSEYGGSGKSFDKNILGNYKSSKPFFLSGGIGLDEIANLTVIAKGRSDLSNLFAIDVNSKFETEPGIKDIEKLKLLMDEVQD